MAAFIPKQNGPPFLKAKLIFYVLAADGYILLFSALLYGPEFRRVLFSPSDLVYRSSEWRKVLFYHNSNFAIGSEAMSESYNEKTSEQGMAISATIVLFEEPPHSFTGLNSFTNETIGPYPHPPAPTQKKPRRRRNECCEISFLIFYAAVCLFFL